MEAREQLLRTKHMQLNSRLSGGVDGLDGARPVALITRVTSAGRWTAVEDEHSDRGHRDIASHSIAARRSYAELRLRRWSAAAPPGRLLQPILGNVVAVWVMGK
jgi:hypothetical protein